MITRDPTKLFMRSCNKCNVMFRPSTKQSRICNGCKKKIKKMVDDRRKEKNGNK